MAYEFNPGEEPAPKSTRTPPPAPLKKDDRIEMMETLRRLDARVSTEEIETVEKLTILHAIESAQRWNLIRDVLIMALLASILGLGVWRTYYLEQAIETQACGKV